MVLGCILGSNNLATPHWISLGFIKGICMKVKELIEQLSKLDPELMLVKAGYEGGMADVTGSGLCRVKLNVNDEWWMGPHELLWDSMGPDESLSEKGVRAVFIS
jgi:hypothetical protein